MNSEQIAELKARHKAYMLRTCADNMSAHGGFLWPKEGPVSCPDWKDSAMCGNGLHGLLWGAGDATLLSWAPDAQWLVVGIDEWVEIGPKVKAPAGDVVYCGDMRGAAALLVALGADSGKCVGSTATAGDEGTATAGDRGTATAGYRGTATAGYRGTATAGDRGTATAGYRGTATAGDRGTATAGDEGTLCIRYFDGRRYRIRIGYIGEDGLQAGITYRLDGDKFVPAPKLMPITELIGKRVKRGPDWKWDNQDENGIGTVADRDGGALWVTVKWAHGGSNCYRWGHEGAVDLEVVAEEGGEA